MALHPQSAQASATAAKFRHRDLRPLLERGPGEFWRNELNICRQTGLVNVAVLVVSSVTRIASHLCTATHLPSLQGWSEWSKVKQPRIAWRGGAAARRRGEQADIPLRLQVGFSFS